MTEKHEASRPTEHFVDEDLTMITLAHTDGSNSLSYTANECKDKQNRKGGFTTGTVGDDEEEGETLAKYMP